MSLFDKLMGKKDDVNKKSDYELRREIFEATKNVKVDMKLIERDAKKYPDRMIFQEVKNPEEFKWRSWALHFSMNGENDKAIAYCNNGIEINPKSAYLFYIRGRSNGDMGQFTEGIEDLNEAIKIKPNYADAFVERGYIKQKIGDTIGAEEDYNRAKEIEPSIVLPRP